MACSARPCPEVTAAQALCAARAPLVAAPCPPAARLANHLAGLAMAQWGAPAARPLAGPRLPRRQGAPPIDLAATPPYPRPGGPLGRRAFPSCAAAKAEAELTAAPALIALAAWRGRVLTGDARFCQRHLGAQVRAAGGDHALLAREHQPTLYRDLALHFDPPAGGPPPPPQLAGAARLPALKRGHRAIENSLHHCKNMTLGAGPTVLAAPREAPLGPLHRPLTQNAQALGVRVIALDARAIRRGEYAPSLRGSDPARTGGRGGCG